MSEREVQVERLEGSILYKMKTGNMIGHIPFKIKLLVEESQQYSNLYGELIDNLDINSIEKNLTSKNANEYLEENK